MRTVRVLDSNVFAIVPPGDWLRPARARSSPPRSFLEERLKLGDPLLAHKDEAVVVPAAHLQELFRLSGCGEQGLAVGIRDDVIVPAVRDQDRRLDPSEGAER